MKIQWLGHSCFKITTDETTVILDPFKEGSVPGFRDIKESANCVLCSHKHHDHYGFECVDVQEKELDFTVKEIESFHDDKQGTLRGMNTIRVLYYKDTSICHLGDLGCMLDDKQIQELQNLDVLLIPVGGFFTVDYKVAKEIVDVLKPKMIIPMHYRLGDTGYDVLSTVSDFTDQFDDVEIVDSPIIDLSIDHKQIVVPTYK